MELEETLRNGVVLAKLGHCFAPTVVPLKKIYDPEQSRYKVRLGGYLPSGAPWALQGSFWGGVTGFALGFNLMSLGEKGGLSLILCFLSSRQPGSTSGTRITSTTGGMR